MVICMERDVRWGLVGLQMTDSSYECFHWAQEWVAGVPMSDGLSFGAILLGSEEEMAGMDKGQLIRLDDGSIDSAFRTSEGEVL